ncbi:hypothetical protein PQX77_003624, partial [Marasmius sp. AFHP31]
HANCHPAVLCLWLGVLRVAFTPRLRSQRSGCTLPSERHHWRGDADSLSFRLPHRYSRCFL